MTGEPHRPSFWTTAPGILTGIAAVITAVTGLMIGLSQQRSAGSSDVRSESAKAATVRAGGAPTKESTVAITAKDGQITSVYADSLRHRQTGRELHLLSGQSISFDRIRAIEVTRLLSDQADIDITLVDGALHKGSIPAGLSPHAFTGTSDLGNFEIRVDKLARIVFER